MRGRAALERERTTLEGQRAVLEGQWAALEGQAEACAEAAACQDELVGLRARLDAEFAAHGMQNVSADHQALL